MGRENVGENSRGRSKSKDRDRKKSKSGGSNTKKRERGKSREANVENRPETPVAPALPKRQGAFSKASHHVEDTTLFRPVKLRAEKLPWWGLHPRWDDCWPPELVPFQLPPPTDEAGNVIADQPKKKAGGAFAKPQPVADWAVEGHEATACFSWGACGEGRLGSGFGRVRRCVPCVVNPVRDPPLLGGPGVQAPTTPLARVPPAPRPLAALQKGGHGGGNNKTLAAPASSDTLALTPRPTISDSPRLRTPSGHADLPPPDWTAWDGITHARPSARLVGVACGTRHALAVSDEGVVYSCGDGHYGQLGNRKVERFSAATLYDEDDDEGNHEEGGGGSPGRSALAIAGSPHRLNGLRSPSNRSPSPSGKGSSSGLSAAQRALAAKRRNGSKKPGANNKDKPRGLHEILTGTGAAAESLQRVSLVRPQAVLPSGVLKRGKDLVSIEVAAGSTVSFAREANRFEGATSVAGLDAAAAAVNRLLSSHRDFFGLRELSTHLREEQATAGRAYGGSLLAWGTGHRGELGLGEGVCRRNRPTVVGGPLWRVHVLSLSAGKKHALAKTEGGFLFSWGCGADGRLGHNDYNDRWEPIRIEALAHGVVGAFAAGDAHSLAVLDTFRPDPTKATTTAGAPRPKKKPPARKTSKRGAKGASSSSSSTNASSSSSSPSAAAPTPKAAPKSLHEMAKLAFPAPGVYTWGRGAHGRLGNGRNHNRRAPTRVDVWPDSFASQGFRVMGAALGGAHSVVLAEKRVQPSLVNPQGVHRLVYAFGYGSHGALGTGLPLIDAYLPVRVPLPSHELIAQVSAGKSSSFCVTNLGEAYGWGLNRSGECGTGDYVVTTTPTRLFTADAIASDAATQPHARPPTGGVGRSGIMGAVSNSGGGTKGGWNGGSSGMGVSSSSSGEKGQSQQKKSPLSAPATPSKMSSGSTPAVVLRVCGGDASSLALGLRGRPAHLHQQKLRESLGRGAQQDSSSEDLVFLGMPKVEASVLQRWNCARRCPHPTADPDGSQRLATGAPRKLRSGEMFACVTCNISTVCRTCALWCHVRHGHVLKGRPASGHYASRQLCECSLTDACHLLVSISEGVPPHYHTAAVQTQRAVRQWLATRELKRRQQAKWQLRHHVATRTWQAAVTDPIWRVVTEATASRQLAYERASMAVCDGKSAAARKYLKLQRHLLSIETQAMVIGALVASTGCLDPHASVRERWWDPTGYLTGDVPLHMKKLRRQATSLVKTMKPPKRSGVPIPVTRKALEQQAAAEEEAEAAAADGKADGMKAKSKKAPPKPAAGSSGNNGAGGGGGGGGASGKDGDRDPLPPISPYMRYRSRRALRQAQREYRHSERIRPNSKLEVALTRDLPSYGHADYLSSVPDVDVTCFIRIAQAAGVLQPKGDPVVKPPKGSLEDLMSGSGGGSGGSTGLSAAPPSGGAKGATAAEAASGNGKANAKKPVEKVPPAVAALRAAKAAERAKRLAAMRRGSSLAAPSLLYRRVCTVRHALNRKLTVKRRLSFDKNARLVKGATDEDQRLFGPESPGGGTAILEGARNSVNLAKRALIPRILSPNPLAAKGVGARSKSGDALRKNPNGLSHMLVPSLPLSPCFEVGPLVVRFQADQAAWRFLGTSAPFPDESVSSNATTGVAAIAKKRFAPFPESLTYEDAARRHLAAVPYPSLVPEDYRVKKQGPLQRNDSNSRGASKGLGAVDAHLGSSKETEVGEEGNAAASTSKREQQQQQVRNNSQRPRRAPQRRHSVAAPERLHTMLSLWERHLHLVASLSQNPLPRSGHHFAGVSGARNDDDVISASAYHTRLSKAGVAVGLTAASQVGERLKASAWAAESAYIEALAESNDYSLEDPEAVAERELERLLLEQEKQRDPFAATGMSELSAKKKKKGKKKKKDKAKKTAKADDEGDGEGSSSEEEGDEGEREHEAAVKLEEEVEPGANSSEDAPPDNLALALVSDESTAAAIVPENSAGMVWTEAYDGEGTPYYYNEQGETVWELPEGDTAVPEEYHPSGLEGDESNGGAKHAWEAEGGGDSAWDTEEYGGESAWGPDEEGGEGYGGGEGAWGDAEGGGDGGYGEGWEEAYDDQGVAYWYNATTGESAYE